MVWRKIPLFILFAFIGILSPESVKCQGIQGVVLTAEDRIPIDLAEILLVDLATGASVNQITNESGAFRISRPPGLVNLIEVSALGFLTHVDTLYLSAPEDSLTVEIRLGVDAIALEPLVVVGATRPLWESTQPRYLWEYFEREEIYSRLGAGRFFDREALDTRFGPVENLAQLETLWPVMGTSRDRSCNNVGIFVDGMEFRALQGGSRQWGIHSASSEIPWGIGDLVGVEVYVEVRDIPAEFQTRRVPFCRVMALWTEKPVIPDNPDEGARSKWLIPIIGFLAVIFVFSTG